VCVSVCVCECVSDCSVAATKYHIVYNAKLSQLHLMHLPKTNFIVDLLLTCLFIFGSVLFCFVAFVFGFMAPKWELLNMCFSFWPMKMFALFNYCHCHYACCCHCRCCCCLNYKMRLSVYETIEGERERQTTPVAVVVAIIPHC